MKNSRDSEKSGDSFRFTPHQSNFVEIEERVRYSEIDQMGIAHNVSYFEWFEIGRTEYCRQIDLPYKKIEEQGYYFVVAEAFCRYKKPLRYDQVFIIRTTVDELSPKKAVFYYQLVNKEDKNLIAEGYTVHLVTNSQGEITPLPEELFKKFKKD
ncbi:MAG: acyl-CoA thioesterase [Candidatus Aminicenantia bacterium]